MKDLNSQLVELFDMRKKKVHQEKELNNRALEAQKDIRMLTVMFRDGIPSLEVKIDEGEYIVWDAHSSSLLYVKGKTRVMLEAAEREVRIKARPFLFEMVAQAKKFYL